MTDHETPQRACLTIEARDPECPALVDFGGAVVLVPRTVRLRSPGQMEVLNGVFYLLPIRDGFRSRVRVRRCLAAVIAAKSALRYL